MEFLISPDGYYANLMLNDYELWPNVSTMIRDIGFYSWNLMNYRNDSDFSLSSVQSMAYNPDFQVNGIDLHFSLVFRQFVTVLSCLKTELFHTKMGLYYYCN
jgi:hypothetical protein